MNMRVSGKRLPLAIGMLFLLAPATCQAGVLPVSFQPNTPVISGSNGSITYNASTGDFSETLNGASLDYAAPFVLPRGFAVFSGSFDIDLDVDHNGNFVANGKGLVLTGTVTINKATFSGTLLSGTVTDFGSPPAGPPSFTFDGLFTVTGGSLTQTVTGTSGPVFGGFPLGATGGFLLDAENVTGGTLGNFGANFSSSSVKPEVGVAAPEPSTLLLTLFGASLFWFSSHIGVYRAASHVRTSASSVAAAWQRAAPVRPSLAVDWAATRMRAEVAYGDRNRRASPAADGGRQVDPRRIHPPLGG